MQDIAMISMDLLQNSLSASANLIQWKYSVADDLISLSVEDNGSGMDDKTLLQVDNPFFSTRSTRRIGLGIPFFKQLVTQCEGDFSLNSMVNQGTLIKGSWSAKHWDNPPLGNIGELVLLILHDYPSLELDLIFDYHHQIYCFNSKQVAEALAPLPLNNYDVLQWVELTINQAIQKCQGGMDYEEYRRSK
ncbi:MAG: ATP-binding protein [Erysipelotrichaceae bacterium]